MTDLSPQDTSIGKVLTPLLGRISLHITGVTLACLIAAIGVLTLLAMPWLLWAYNIHYAGKAAQTGLVWPEPRRSDSLPIEQDRAALQNALGHLAAAQRWKPDQATTHRMVGQVYAAQQDWRRAAHAYEEARTHDPANPLLAWEAALIYEQMSQLIEQAPRETLLSKLISAPYESQALAMGNEACYGDQPDRCYIGLATWSKPYAGTTHGTASTFDTLVMHAPGGIRLTHRIHETHPVLSFLVGLAPEVGDGQTDGATFSILIESQAGDVTQMYEHTMSRNRALQGWHPDMVDLSPWAGQTVTLIFRLDGGPSGHTLDDWYGWANVILTTREAAEAITFAPHSHIQVTWDASGYGQEQFVVRGDEAIRMGQFENASRWYRRALMTKEILPPIVQFRHGIVDTVTYGRLSSPLDPAVLPIHKVNRQIHINAKTLQWFRVDEHDGNHVVAHTHNNSQVGILNWSGATVAVVDVQRQGVYDIFVKVQHTQPPPIEIWIEHNFTPLTKVELDRGDLSWQEIETQVTLDRGLHAIGIRFMNDAYVDGLDRNAVIDSVRLEWKQ